MENEEIWFLFGRKKFRSILSASPRMNIAEQKKASGFSFLKSL